jgi:hypothetical protein
MLCLNLTKFLVVVQPGFTFGGNQPAPTDSLYIGLGIIKHYTFADTLFEPVTSVSITSSGSTYTKKINVGIFVVPSMSFLQGSNLMLRVAVSYPLHSRFPQLANVNPLRSFHPSPPPPQSSMSSRGQPSPNKILRRSVSLAPPQPSRLKRQLAAIKFIKLLRCRDYVRRFSWLVWGRTRVGRSRMSSLARLVPRLLFRAVRDF